MEGEGKMAPFQSPQENTLQSKLGPFDQIMATVLGFILVTLLGWIAYTSYQNSIGIAEVKIQILTLRDSRDLSLLVLEKRLDKVEAYIDEQKSKPTR